MFLQASTYGEMSAIPSQYSATRNDDKRLFHFDKLKCCHAFKKHGIRFAAEEMINHEQIYCNHSVRYPLKQSPTVSRLIMYHLESNAYSKEVKQNAEAQCQYRMDRIM